MKNISNTMPSKLTIQEVKRLVKQRGSERYIGDLRDRKELDIEARYISYGNDPEFFTVIDNHLYNKSGNSEYVLLNNRHNEKKEE